MPSKNSANSIENSYDWSAMRAGPTGALSVAAVVMSASFMGFGALVRALGFDLEMGLATIPIIWALPGQVLYLSMVAQGAGLVAVFLAVTLAAVRLMPMVMLVLSEVALEKAPKLPQFILAYFIAMTTWVLAQERVPHLPRRQRLPWLLGLALTLLVGMLAITSAGYFLAGIAPPLLAAALAFLTPVFFYLALFVNARFGFDYTAAGLGTALIWPLMNWLPDYDILVAGLVGGTVAWLFSPRRRKKS